MQASGTGSLIGFNFVYLLFLLVPGILFLQAVLHRRQKLDTIPRLDKIGYVVAGGGLSAFELALSYRLITGDLQYTLEAVQSLTNHFMELPTPVLDVLILNYLLFPFFRELLLLSLSVSALTTHFLSGSSVSLTDLSGISILALLSAVVIQSMLAYGSGDLLGRVLREHYDNGEKLFAETLQPWDRAAETIERQEVVVYTRSGQVIKGTVFRYGSGPREGCLTLQSPILIDRYGGATAGKRLGNEVYIDRSDISQIHYDDEDYRIDESSVPGEEENSS